MIIYLYGPDTLRSRRKLTEIKEKFTKEVDPNRLNIDVLDGSKMTAEDFSRAVTTVSFLAKKRLVIVEDLLSKNTGVIQEAVLEQVQKLGEGVVVVFFESGAAKSKARTRKASKKTASDKRQVTSKKTEGLLNFLAEQKYAQEFKLLNPAETRAWAAAEVTRLGGKIEPVALTLLCDIVGPDLWRLENELTKLLAFAGSAPITKTLVEEQVNARLEADVFKLTDAIGAKNSGLALRLITEQLGLGTTPLELLARITWQFRCLLLVKAFVEEYGTGYSADRMATQLGIHPFVVQKTLASASHYTLDGLRQTFRQLLLAEHQLKSSAADPSLVLDLLIVKA